MFRRRTTGSPVQEFAEGKILHSGNLLKRGHVNTSLKQRWFVLMEQKLFYSNGPDQKPIACIPLDQALIRPAVEHGPHDFAFEIVTDKSSRVYFLVASSQQEMLVWIELLSQQTRLNKENHLIEMAEELIAKAAQFQARLDEETDLMTNEGTKNKKSHIPGGGWIGRSPSASNLVGSEARADSAMPVLNNSGASPYSGEKYALMKCEGNLRFRQG